MDKKTNRNVSISSNVKSSIIFGHIHMDMIKSGMAF